MKWLSRSIISFLFVISLWACQQDRSDFSLSPQPIVGETYTYHLESVSTRSFADEEEVMTQDYTFNFTFDQPAEGYYPAYVVFETYDIERPEDVRFTEIMAGVQHRLLNDTATFALSPKGTFAYQTTVDYSIFEEADQFGDPERYIELMTLYMEENIRSNHFLEWVDYAPDTLINTGSRWYTTSSLNLMGLVDIDRTFDWEVETVKANSITIKGSSQIGNFEFKLGEEQLGSMNMLFEGDITSTYHYTISRPDYMVLEAEITIETNGIVKNKVDDVLDGSIINEPLIGKAQTTLKRVR